MKRVKCPIAVDCQTNNGGDVSMDVYVGRFPSVRFDVNQETIVTVKGINEAKT